MMKTFTLSCVILSAVLATVSSLTFSSASETGNERMMLHSALENNDLKNLATLIADGADVNAKMGANWTYLHFALSYGREYEPAVMMLVEHGADVNAATGIAGWTPLHLAVPLNSSEIIVTLIKHGANVNARTRVGGWTPLDLALQMKDADEVVKTLRASGGEEQKHADRSFPPLFSPLYTYTPSSYKEISGINALPPSFHRAGGRTVEGSFTILAGTERLIFDSFGMLDESGGTDVVGFIDKDDRTNVLWFVDGHTRFLGLCRDPLTGLDHTIFYNWTGGNSHSSETISYWYYDVKIGSFVHGFTDIAQTLFIFNENGEIVDEHGKSIDINSELFEEYDLWDEYGKYLKEKGSEISMVDARGNCRWREKKKALETLKAIVQTLRVHEEVRIDKWIREPNLNQKVLPTRVIPSSVVESSLKTLRELSFDLVSVLNASDEQIYNRGPLQSQRWEIVLVDASYTDYPYHQGVALIYDKQNAKWRSIYDCSTIAFSDIRDSTLFVALGECSDPQYKFPDTIEVEVDLLTYKVKPDHRNHELR